MEHQARQHEIPRLNTSCVKCGALVTGKGIRQHHHDKHEVTNPEVRAIAILKSALKRERERCARACEALGVHAAAEACASAIRALGDENDPAATQADGHEAQLDRPN